MGVGCRAVAPWGPLQAPALSSADGGHMLSRAPPGCGEFAFCPSPHGLALQGSGILVWLMAAA